jgi:hypothetical protein
MRRSLSGDCGSLRLTVRDHSWVQMVRVYPTYVHMIKNVHNEAYDERPGTIACAKRRFITLMNVFNRATSMRSRAFAWDGALRFEIRFERCSLVQALSIAPRVLCAFAGAVRWSFLSKDNYVDRVHLVHIRGLRDELLRHRDNLPVTGAALSLIACLENAVGWSNWRINLDAGVVRHRKFPWQGVGAFDMLDTIGDAVPGDWYNMEHRFLPPGTTASTALTSPFMSPEFRHAAALEDREPNVQLQQASAAANMVPPPDARARVAIAAAPRQAAERAGGEMELVAEAADSDDEFPRVLLRSLTRHRRCVLRDIARWLKTVDNPRTGGFGAVTRRGILTWCPDMISVVAEVARRFGLAWRLHCKARDEPRIITGLRLRWAR